MSEKRVAPPDGGSGDLVLIQRHLENLSAGEILEELDARMEEMTAPPMPMPVPVAMTTA